MKRNKWTEREDQIIKRKLKTRGRYTYKHIANELWEGEKFPNRSFFGLVQRIRFLDQRKKEREAVFHSIE